MAEVIWTEPALSDLNEITEYIALENIVAAKQLVQTIFSKVERLQTLPESGSVHITIYDCPVCLPSYHESISRLTSSEVSVSRCSAAT